MNKDSPKPWTEVDPIAVRPIGVARTPFADKASAPRQPAAATGIQGRIELFEIQGLEHALSDLATCDHIWVLFWFHLAQGFRPKVLPPRSRARRGLFATRSPHRPNPIGLSVLRLLRVEANVLHVANVDLVDGSPVLDVKPYVAYTDAIPGARVGWLEEEERAIRGEERQERQEAQSTADPVTPFHVVFSEVASEQLAFLGETGADLRQAITRVLSLGPAPHPYRRIRKQGDGFSLAVKDWRAAFRTAGHEVTVDAILTGYRPAQIQSFEAPEIHRRFADRFPLPRS